MSSEVLLGAPDVLDFSDLRAIRQDLDKIASQNRLLLIFFKNVNKLTMDECIDRLNNSLRTFQVRETAHLLDEISMSVIVRLDGLSIGCIAPKPSQELCAEQVYAR